MKRNIFKSKIHRATVTEANLDYEGSVTIDSGLMKAADILPYEQIHVWNITNGSRMITYAIEGKKDSGTICVNGAGAKLCKVGDLVIIATFAEIQTKKAIGWNPIIVNVHLINRKNVLYIPGSGDMTGPTRTQAANDKKGEDSSYLRKSIG
jgi:aspartate 1-decarboxylase